MAALVAYSLNSFVYVLGLAVVHEGLTDAWKILYTSLSAATVTTIDHKYVLFTYYAPSPWYKHFGVVQHSVGLGPVHTSAFSFENAYISMRLGLPSTLIRSNTLSVFTENASI